MKNYVVKSKSYLTIDPCDSSNQKLLLQKLIASETQACAELEELAEQITFYGCGVIQDQVADRKAYLHQLNSIYERLFKD